MNRRASKSVRGAEYFSLIETSCRFLFSSLKKKKKKTIMWQTGNKVNSLQLLNNCHWFSCSIRLIPSVCLSLSLFLSLLCRFFLIPIHRISSYSYFFTFFFFINSLINSTLQTLVFILIHPFLSLSFSFSFAISLFFSLFLSFFIFFHGA